MRTIQLEETTIHDGTLQDLIAAHLYATTKVADDEEILSLILSEPNPEGLRRVVYKSIKNKEVELIIHS